MRLDEIDTMWVIMGFVVVSATVLLIFRKNTGDPLTDKLHKFKMSLLLGGLFLVLMWLILPKTPSLSTFGYPEDASDVDSPEEILTYLQRYNDTLVRTLEILGWTFFIMAFWVVSTAYQFLKAFSDHLKGHGDRNNENIF